MSETISIDVDAAAAGQCALLTKGAEGICGAAGLVQPTVTWQPFETVQFSVKTGFALGNAINFRTGLPLAPWGVDQEDEMMDINGRGRDHLLTAWYRQAINIGESTEFAISGGLIDATDYVDTNAFANDEFSQFMNVAFINSVLVEPPSYDYGAVVEVSHDRWTIHGVYMNVGENDDGRSYNYFAGEVAYRFGDTNLPGNMRILASGTDARFSAPDGDNLAALFAVSMSLDKQVTPDLGLFARAGGQLTEAAVDYGFELTGGVSLKGSRWGRPEDTVGLGLGTLFGGNDDVDHTVLAEVYYAASLTENTTLTADVQAIRSENVDGTETAGLIVGVRASASF